jgi:hypothetical protein
MLRIIVILLAIIIVLSVIKRIYLRYRYLSSDKTKTDKYKKPAQGKDDNIVDAKFEEIK